jgi:hypothetical protein
MIDWILFERLLFLPVGLALGAIAVYFGFTYVGIGIIAGFAIPVYAHLRGEPAYTLTFGFALATISLVSFSVSIYFANKYGMSFQELDEARHLPKYIRRAPYISVFGLTSSIVTISYCMVRRWWKSKNQL